MSGVYSVISQIFSQFVSTQQVTLDQRFTAMAESIAEMQTEIDELRRRLNQVVRFGVVAEIHESNKLIKVKHGERSTQFIKWFTLSGGDMIHYRCPSIGELALIVDISSGSSSQYLALCGWESDKYPFPISNPKHVLTQFGELKLLWDSEKNELTFEAPAQINFKTPILNCDDETLLKALKSLKVETKNLESTGEVTDMVRSMSEDRDLYNAHNNHLNATPPNMPQ